MVQKYVHALLFAALSFIASLSQGAANPAPHSAKYHDVPIYSISQLKQNLSRIVLVDVRSRYEFETMRIKGAINIPVASKNFVNRVKMLRKKTIEPIVFYCNGLPCRKSSLALEKAQEAKIRDVHAYEAGMYQWVETYPSESLFRGKNLVNTTKIIPQERFHQHMLRPSVFSSKAYDLESSIILDVRDEYQRNNNYLFPGKVFCISLDNQAKLQKFIEKAKQAHKTLFIFDQAGRQVQWLQYMLVQTKLNNYYFMQDGVNAYYATYLKVSK